MAYTLTFNGVGTTGTVVQDVDPTDSPNTGRTKLNNNFKVLVDAHNDHDAALSGLTGGVADLSSNQAFSNKTILSNGGGGGTNTIKIGRADISDTYLSFTNRWDNMTIGDISTLGVVASSSQVTISGYGGFQTNVDNINKNMSFGFPQAAYLNHTAGSQSFVINNNTITAGNTFDVAGNAVVRNNLGIGTSHTATAEYDVHIKNSTGTGELAIESLDSHAILHLQSDTDEGQDSRINFSADAAVKGAINFDHNPTADNQKMQFSIGDGANTPLTIVGNKRIGVNQASPATMLHVDGTGVNTELGGIRQTASGGSVSMWHGTATGVLETIQDTDLEIRTNSTTNDNQLYLDSATGNIAINHNSPKHHLHTKKSIMLGTSDSNEYVHFDGKGAFQADSDVLITADVNQTSTPAGNIIFGFGSSASGQSTGTSDFAATYPSGVPSNEYMRILSTGNIGIGLTNPTSKLHVKGTNGTHFSVDGTSAAFNFTTNSTSGYASTFEMDDSGLSIGHNSASRKIFLKTANTTRLTVRDDGRVGIGTTSPDSLLHLESSSGDTVLKIEADIDDNAEGDNPIILFAQDGGQVQGSVGLNVDNNLLIANQWENNDSDIVFNAFNVERMRIKGSGNVGIGTSSPTQKLDVVGSANISSNLTVAGSLSVGGTTQFTSNDPKVVDQNLIIEDHTLGDTGSDWSVQQGLVVHQTGASATENARKGFVGLNWENASYYPVMRIGPDDSTAWDYNVMISSHAGLGLPYGTSSQRPITNNTKARTKSGGNGLIRYNTTTKLVEVYTDQGTGTARWEPISCPPVGGTYIQVKNSVHPGTLWSGTVWVSSDVPSGAFVRQEGGKAAAFGHSGVQGQQIMQHDHKSNEYSSSGDSIRSVRAGTRERTHQRRKTAYTTGVLFGGGWDDEGLGTSVGSENRPPNATVKFWRRTG
tara:strand:- start:2759 stop:5551 length:2793 start_codon:yes stop_codon:yes gene_type:complete